MTVHFSAAMLGCTALNLGCLGGVMLTAPTHNLCKTFLIPSTKPLPLWNSLKPVSSWKSRAVAAIDSSDPTGMEEQTEKKKTYHFLVANAKFMMDEEEHFKELLAERLRLYGERDKEQDFWLVTEPKFLDKFPNVTKRLKRPAVALVSTNGTWIKFMKLRLDRVLQDCFDADNAEEALSSNPVNLEFEKPESWTAPYPKYEYGWWEPFLPQKKSSV